MRASRSRGTSQGRMWSHGGHLHLNVTGVMVEDTKYAHDKDQCRSTWLGSRINKRRVRCHPTIKSNVHPPSKGMLASRIFCTCSFVSLMSWYPHLRQGDENENKKKRGIQIISKCPCTCIIESQMPMLAAMLANQPHHHIVRWRSEV